MTPEEMEARIAELESAVEDKDKIISVIKSESEDKDKKIAELESAVEALKASRGEKRKITKADFVTMTKGGESIDVHPASVDEHTRLGWVKK